MSDSNGEDREVIQEILSEIWQPDVGSSSEVTLGRWEKEEDAAKAFDIRVDWSGLFSEVYREVRGEYIQPKIGSEVRCPRLDRVLMPNQKLIDAGWVHGPIGVEIEGSNRKIAGPLEQVLDYTRAIWTIREGFHIWIERFFIWPWNCGAGNVESIAVQHRIGGVYGNKWTPLVFKVGGMCAISVKHDRTFTAKQITSGKRTGHRARKRESYEFKPDADS